MKQKKSPVCCDSIATKKLPWLGSNQRPTVSMTFLRYMLYQLSYTAYHSSVCCDVIATTKVYTPASFRHPWSHCRDVCQCYR